MLPTNARAVFISYAHADNESRNRKERYKRAKYKYPDPKTGPQEFTLASIQAANPPSETLTEMTEGAQNRVLEKVADQLADLLSANPK